MSDTPEIVRKAAELGAAAVELLGVAVIAVTAIYSLLLATGEKLRRKTAEEIFQVGRRRLGRGTLFGLEMLVAADIIHTVAVELTFRTVGVLAIVVLIRTFLSFTLELELTGKWPWQHSA